MRLKKPALKAKATGLLQDALGFQPRSNLDSTMTIQRLYGELITGIYKDLCGLQIWDRAQKLAQAVRQRFI